MKAYIHIYMEGAYDRYTHMEGKGNAEGIGGGRKIYNIIPPRLLKQYMSKLKLGYICKG
jgi:hypothetical protein